MAKKKRTIKQKMLNLRKFGKKDKRILIQGIHAGEFSKDGRHVEERYKVKKIKGKEGKLILELTPFKTLQNRRAELIDKLSKSLAEKMDNRELMKDILEDVNIMSLEKLDTAIGRGAKIESKEGCYFFKIKDPRHKKPYTLKIRS